MNAPRFRVLDLNGAIYVCDCGDPVIRPIAVPIVDDRLALYGGDTVRNAATAAGQKIAEVLNRDFEMQVAINNVGKRT